MRNSFYVLTVSLLAMLSACKTTNSTTNVKVYSLADVECLKLGVEDRSSLESRFGKPDQVLSLDTPKEEFWVYFENSPQKGTRISLGFSPETNKLISVYWGVRGNDPEKNLKNALLRFSGSQFEKSERPWTNPHAASNEKILVNKKNGMTLVYEDRDEGSMVHSFSWNLSEQTSTLSAN